MSTALNLPLWQCNSPPKSPDSCEDLDLIARRFSVGKPYCGVAREDSLIPLDNGMTARRSSSRMEMPRKFGDTCRVNKNASDSGDCDIEKCDADSAGQSGSVRTRSGTGSSDADLEKKRRKKSAVTSRNVGMCQSSSECVATTVGGDDDDGEQEELKRSPRQQHELTPYDEINNPDVTGSRGITSNPSIGTESRAGNRKTEACVNEEQPSSSASCSAGSYLRRKHHKHHKHRRRNRSPIAEEPTSVSPKVNPIFLWVRQDDTRILEVVCEDYDHRNRIRLTRTHLGWRAIPKTERFAAAIIPKPPPSSETLPEEKRNRPKRGRKKKKSKKEKVPVEPMRDDTNIEKSSTTLRHDEEQCQVEEEDSKNHSNCSVDVGSIEASESPCRERPRASRSSSEERELMAMDDVPRLGLTKSFSCDSLVSKRERKLIKSVSIDLNMDDETRLALERNFEVQNKLRDKVQPIVEESCTVDETLIEVPKIPEEAEGATKEGAKEKEVPVPVPVPVPLPELDDKETVPGEVSSTSQEDVTEADCDELEVPGTEVNEEEALEEEDWSTPTDLTVPKTKSKEKELPKVRYSILPSSTTAMNKSSEPFNASLPELTITPIPNLTPAHQQKRQNNFLESLLSSPYPVKPEKDELLITRTTYEKRLSDKKKLYQPELDIKNKKMKMEDITLKSLLSKQHNDRVMKGIELENYVKKIKSKHESESVDVSKSRLHELLTEGVSSSSSNSDPITQLKQVLSNPDLAVPDPLLVPRARLPALVMSPASEIPRLLSMHLEKVDSPPCPPITDSDMLEVSLSNLRSLLLRKTDKMKPDADDLASYQQSMELLLGWKRYQSELMEAQMKNSHLTSRLSPADIDLNSAPPLNPMMWLPYLDLSGSSNALSSPMTYPHNYHNNLTSLPHLNANHFPQQSSFMTSTSPMDLEAQAKTISMWQEAVMSQHTAHHSRNPPNGLLSSQHDGRLKAPNGSATRRKRRLSPTPSPHKLKNQEVMKEHFNFDGDLQLQKVRQEAVLRHQQQMQRKKLQKRINNLHNHRQLDIHRNRQDNILHRLQGFDTDAEKKSRDSISVKPVMDKCGRQGRKQSWQMFERELRKSPERVQMTWRQFEEEIRKNRANGKITEGSAESSHQSGQSETEVPKKEKETAKLKVKNLVDPNMSPPNLLKQISPEGLASADDSVPLQDVSQSHLWHPLFGRSHRLGCGPFDSSLSQRPEDGNCISGPSSEASTTAQIPIATNPDSIRVKPSTTQEDRPSSQITAPSAKPNSTTVRGDGLQSP